MEKSSIQSKPQAKKQQSRTKKPATKSKKNKPDSKKLGKKRFSDEQLNNLAGCGQSQMDFDSTAIIVGISAEVIQNDEELLNIYLKQKYTAEMLTRLVLLDKGLSGDSSASKQYLELAAGNVVELDFGDES